MRALVWNSVLAVTLLAAGGVFFLTLIYAIRSIFDDFGAIAAVVSGLAQIIVWLGIASLFDKRQ